MIDVKRAAILMEEALTLLDAAGEDHAAALLDYAITQLPAGSSELRELPSQLASDHEFTSH